MFDLDRFITAQNNCGMYELALSEIKAGSKRNHWIWFVFPQIHGLGRSATSQKFAISSLLEAKAYLDNDLLGNRLREAANALLELNCTVEDAFGGLDAMKTQSSMTLFDLVSPNDVFEKVLNHCFNGERCKRTLQIVQ